jgi:YfiH family protein
MTDQFARDGRGAAKDVAAGERAVMDPPMDRRMTELYSADLASGGVRRPPSPQWLIPDWPAPPGVRALSTLRVGGSSRAPFASLNLGDHVGDAPIAVARNRRALREAAGLPAEPCWLAQVHGTQVADLDAAAMGGSAEATVMVGQAEGAEIGRQAGAWVMGAPADAAVTSEPGRVCAILTADCLPILLAAAPGGRVAAAHAGWRGLAAGVIEAVVHKMGVAPRDVMAWLGPAIGPRYFEIGPEVREAFLKEDPGAGMAFTVSARGERDDARGAVGERGALGGAGSAGDDAPGTGTGMHGAWNVEEGAGGERGSAAGTRGAGHGKSSAGTRARGAGGERYLADLYVLARRRLTHLGVERIYGGGECTYASAERYFSYRRDGQTGRQASLIWMEPSAGG